MESGGLGSGSIGWVITDFGDGDGVLFGVLRSGKFLYHCEFVGIPAGLGGAGVIVGLPHGPHETLDAFLDCLPDGLLASNEMGHLLGTVEVRIQPVDLVHFLLLPQIQVTVQIGRFLGHFGLLGDLLENSLGLGRETRDGLAEIGD